MLCSVLQFMSEKSEKELKKLDQEEMKEETHQLELKEGYEQDEKYEESEEQILNSLFNNILVSKSQAVCAGACPSYPCFL